MSRVQSFRLLECYGGHTGHYWRTFLQALDSETSEAVYPAVTDGACTAFRYFNTLE